MFLTSPQARREFVDGSRLVARRLMRRNKIEGGHEMPTPAQR